MAEHKFDYNWTLKDAIFTKDKGKVFSCFACGGGSTMGYKLAGFDVVGCNEIDPKMMEVYRINHNPKFSYCEPIQTFKNRDNLPEELYNLDILDGSPPCSSFSMAGNREKDWGKEKKFREGQSEQVLDTLFFDFIDLAKKLQPKVIIAENVKGLICGNAKAYVDKIYDAFYDAGYIVGMKLLDASRMGVPQKRQRVFFCAIRNDIVKHIKTCDLFGKEPYIDLEFNEKEIPFIDIAQHDKEFKILEYVERWERLPEGKNWQELFNTSFSTFKPNRNEVLPTITATQRKSFFTGIVHPVEKRKLNDIEFCLAGTFPKDYNFMCDKSENHVGYVVGMSVPPVMTAQIATRIYEQWLLKIQ